MHRFSRHGTGCLWHLLFLRRRVIMAEQDLDRNEAATPYKLEKAKEKGQVAKSSDAVSVIVFLVALTFLYWRGLDGMRELFRFDFSLIAKARRSDAHGESLWWLISEMLSSGIYMLLPFFLAIMIAAIVGNLLQTGGTF